MVAPALERGILVNVPVLTTVRKNSKPSIQDRDNYCCWLRVSEVTDDAVDTAAGVSGVSVFTSVVTGNVSDTESTLAETGGETCSLATVSESSSIDGHDVPAGTLLNLSFNAFRANCLCTPTTSVSLTHQLPNNDTVPPLKKLSCRRETVQCFVSLNILLSHSRLFEMIPLSRARVSPY